MSWWLQRGKAVAQIKWKRALLALSQVTRNWGKESDFIQEANKQRRWQLSVLKSPWESPEFRLILWQGKGRIRGVCGREVVNDHRHLDATKGPRGRVELLYFCPTNSRFPWPQSKCSYKSFCKQSLFLYIPSFSLGRQFWAEVVSVIPKLQVRFLF